MQARRQRTWWVGAWVGVKRWRPRGPLVAARTRPVASSTPQLQSETGETARACAAHPLSRPAGLLLPCKLASAETALSPRQPCAWPSLTSIGFSSLRSTTMGMSCKAVSRCWRTVSRHAKHDCKSWQRPWAARPRLAQSRLAAPLVPEEGLGRHSGQNQRRPSRQGCTLPWLALSLPSSDASSWRRMARST